MLSHGTSWHELIYLCWDVILSVRAAAQVTVTDCRGVDRKTQRKFLKLPLRESFQVIGRRILAVPNQQDFACVTHNRADLRLELCAPEIVVVKIVAEISKMEPFQLLLRERGADHCLALRGRPGVFDVWRSPVTTKRENDILRLRKCLSQQLRVGIVEGLKATNDDRIGEWV